MYNMYVGESYTLLLMIYTAQQRPNQDHRTESHSGWGIMSTSEEKFSEKAKTVDDESGTRVSYGH